MKKEKIKMLKDLVLVRKLKSEDKTPSGLIIPFEAREEGRYLEVVEVSAKVHGIKKGDIVVAQGERPGGQDFHFNGEDLIVMRQKYICAVME